MNNCKYTENRVSAKESMVLKEGAMKMSISCMSMKAKWNSQTESISNKKHKPQWIDSLPDGSTK